MGIKIASVILAVILWFFVTSRGQSEITLDVPIELKNIPRELESVKQGAKSISVSIKGQERLIKNIKPASVRVQVDLSKARKGKATYHINKDDIKIPPTMTVANISPSSVWIVLEETVIRTVPVRTVVVGSPAKGFEVELIEVNPKTVTIEGARTELGGIKFLKTEPVNVSDLDKTYVQEARLDMGGRNIRPQIQEVAVKVVIKRGGR